MTTKSYKSQIFRVSMENDELISTDGEIFDKKEEKPNQEERKIEAKNFFSTQKKKLGLYAKRGERVVYIDFNELSEHSPELSEDLINQPEETMRILELALAEGGIILDPKVRLETISKTQELNIRNIRARNLGTMISIEGIVRQASEVRPQVINARFECPACGTILSILQVEKRFREPNRCSSCGRRGGFRLLTKEMVDAQRLVIEESPDSLSGGEQPKRMQVFLKEDLVDPKMEDRTTPGSKVRVIGVLKEISLPLPTGIQTRFDLAIEANNVIPLEESFDDLSITEEEENQIKELAAEKNIIEKLAKSISPSVWGYPEIKEALALQLFGGVQKRRSDGTLTRGDIHILMVGDPGVAKSVMLKFISTIAPKGRYVSGKSASGAGLTATVVKDEFLRGWALEAGAMVLSNKGLVCIDELEKMDENDRSTMHEAMEQQCMLPDFKLLLSNGQEMEIGPLVDSLMDKNKNKIIRGKDCEILPVEDIELLSTDFTNTFSLRADRISRHVAPKEFIEIELTNGREITVTPEHPCWIVKNGRIVTVPAEKLGAGDFFPIPSRLKIKSNEYMKENDLLCKIIGYHIGDGCYESNNKNRKTGIRFCHSDPVLIEDYKNSVEKYFKLKAKIVKKENQIYVEFTSKKLTGQVGELDKTFLEKGEIKTIPCEIMSLPQENIKHLLRALYDNNGSVISNESECKILFVSKNRELELQMSDLLLRFNISSSILKENNLWKLCISGQENLSNFLREIGFIAEEKIQKLRECCENPDNSKGIKDIIPNCNENIKNIFKKLKIPPTDEIKHLISPSVNWQRTSLQKLILIAEKYAILNKEKEILNEIRELKRLAFGFARWIKINKIRRVKNHKISWVYDVTIEPYHTFISNGMILHNTVTISKANVQASLKAQTAVLAAANPKFGRFDPTEMITKQVNLAPSLLNRFDVLFILRDLPDRERDERIAAHVLSEHKQDVTRDIIDRDLLRKYIAYAHQRYKPVLGTEAADKIKKFYVGLRNQSTFGTNDTINKPIPISARQLEALIRLAEANAKARLSKKVEVEDAERAIKLMQYYMMQVGYDEETKSFDIDKISGNPASKRGKIFIVKELLEELETKLGKLIPQEELEKLVGDRMKKDELEEAIEKLVRAGDVFRPRKGYLQRV